MTPLVTKHRHVASGPRPRPGRLLMVVLAVAAACAPPESATNASNAGVAALFAADSAFAADSRIRGAEAWRAAWASSGRMETGGGGQAVGPEEVRSAVAPMLDELGTRFWWAPEHGDVLWPDSLGYTVGRWWIEPGSDTASSTDAGRYLTAWIRERDAWRAALDLSLPACDADTPGTGEFDFWAGEWTVAQRILQQDGSYEASSVARDRVTRVDACVLVENWEGTVRFFWEGMTDPRAVRGASVRAYDDAKDQWRIYWIDTLGGAFGAPFTGSFHEDVGEFFAPPLSEGGQERRIRFTRVGAAVHWELAVRRADGGWLPLWTMNFERPA